MSSYDKALEKQALATVKLYKHCKLSLDRCIEDIEDTCGWSWDLVAKVQEFWNINLFDKIKRNTFGKHGSVV